MDVNFILVMHGDYDNSEGLSFHGIKQASYLADKIKSVLNNQEFEIWSSPAEKAEETAHIIKRKLNHSEIVLKDKLNSDGEIKADFDWLSKEILKSKGKVLIIISHLEYVRFFPDEFGFPTNSYGFAEGVYIKGIYSKGGTCERI